MRFSDFFNIEEVESMSFFNCDLIMDTKLFINPFHIFREHKTSFDGVHDKILKFFNEGFKLAIESKGNKNSVSYKKLQNMMMFPEVEEIALGYSSGSTKGAGSSIGFRDTIISGIFSTIRLGMVKYEHFEEIGIFSEGIGCDRISDITANIIKAELIEYTQEICRELGIQMHEIKVRHSSFDFDFLRWTDTRVLLPINQYNKKPIILVPKRFLDELPTISAEEFWDYIWENKNEILRNDLNYELKSQVNKKDIVKLARHYPTWVREFVKYQEEQEHKPYDFVSDQIRSI